MDMGVREWIQESRFVASLAGYALTGDTLHQGPNTWPVAGMRADVIADARGRISGLGADGREAVLLQDLPADPTLIVVQLTLADATLILLQLPAKNREQANVFARKINQASAYFTAKSRARPDSARTT